MTADFCNLILGEFELVSELPCEFVDDELGHHQLVIHQDIFKKSRAYTGTADMRRDKHGRVDEDSHGSSSLRNTSSSVWMPCAWARGTNLERKVRNLANRR